MIKEGWLEREKGVFMCKHQTLTDRVTIQSLIESLDRLH